MLNTQAVYVALAERPPPTLVIVSQCAAVVVTTLLFKVCRVRTR